MAGITREDQEAAADRAGIIIRAPRTSDLDAFTNLWNEPAVYAGTLQLPWTSSESRQDRFLAMVRGSNPDDRMVVAEDIASGALVGSASIHPSPVPRRRHTASVGMMVATQFEGRGIGTALMAALMHLADHWLQIQRVTLEVYADNEPALALYRKFGFVAEGLHVRDTYRDGAYVDVVPMARIRPLPV
jgi:putative acetyltransferase